MKNNKYSKISQLILQSNSISMDKEKDFIKRLRLALRLDYEYPAIEVRKMNDNKVIETWYEEHKKENIGGSNG